GKGIDIKQAINCDISGNTDIFFDGISTDTRTIKEKEIFLALKGPKYDGHNFIDTLKGKIKGFIVNRDFHLSGGKDFFVIKVDDTLKAYGEIANFWRRKINPKVIGVTGSLGKTTTKELIAGVLSKKTKVLKTEANLNNIIGVSRMLLSIRDQKMVVLEMGINNVGEMQELCKIAEPDIGIITNIAPVHLEGLKSLRNVFEEKKVIFDYAREAIFVNKEDKFLKNYKKKGVKRIFFGKGSPFSYGGHSIINFSKMQVSLMVKDKILNIDFPYINLGLPVLLSSAVAVGKYFNINDEDIKSALESVKLPKLRMEILDINGKKVILDAYNANPVSVKYALKTLLELTGERKTVVLGDIKELGKYSKYYHVVLAKQLATLSLKNIVLIGDEMENCHIYLRDKNIKHYYFKDVFSASKSFEKILHNSDVVLIKGSRAVQLEKILGEDLYAL
ncbi:MAG: UDP-N-acetylmuramoyl-tripeptide--D-alanyl-D-alanine ligase, partial [Proteobacteria bacterium]|nr:UDP-N-acetylmuramoyl-tripeptide--D-alanyl-D-alanine ligase [Pseudomonadota bacterium]